MQSSSSHGRTLIAAAPLTGGTPENKASLIWAGGWSLMWDEIGFVYGNFKLFCHALVMCLA